VKVTLSELLLLLLFDEELDPPPPLHDANANRNTKIRYFILPPRYEHILLKFFFELVKGHKAPLLVQFFLEWNVI
jgi:hypothetical protein